MFLELHILQSFGPTNLNRDEDGNPKDCEFGGVRRARISSQCLKRAIRRSPTFTRLTGVPNGVRSKRMAEQIRDRLVELHVEPEQAFKLGNEFAAAYAVKTEKSKDGNPETTNVLVYFAPKEIEDAASELKTGRSAKDVASDLFKKTQKRTSAPDIALFGRMLADMPVTNLDAAAQVAHAISTHRVDTEYDFYTAVDDLKPSDDPGAGMMGSIGYNSACYYRYARLDWKKLAESLADRELACRTVAAFLQACIDANPSGMGNSHDNQTPPALVLAVVRKEGGGWSLANAFENPVRARGDGGVMSPSVERLADTYQCLEENLGDGSARVFVLALQPELNLKSLEASRIIGRNQWTEAVVAALTNG